MEHLNFCRQFALQCMSGLLVPSLRFEHKTLFAHGLDLCSASQKFILPRNGVLLEDLNLRGLDQDLPLRLPHKFIAIEYISDSHVDDKTPIKSTKRIIFARESDEGILISPASYLDCDGTWAMYGTAIISRTAAFTKPTSGPLFVNSFPIIDSPCVDPNPRDFDGEICVILSFLNVLACSNVCIERSEPRKAGKKIKAALPFDTYHVLTIDVAKSPGAGTGLTGISHRSPREHLRRGHIRRLEDGRRIWVNATVVAAGRGAAKVEKDYRVTNSKASTGAARMAA